MVVAPGFIDLHSHGQDAENYAFKAHDGVTSALELEIGVSPVASWYAERTGKALINCNALVSRASSHTSDPQTAQHEVAAFDG